MRCFPCKYNFFCHCLNILKCWRFLQAAAKTRKGRYAKKYSIAESTLQAVGLPCKQLNTITMQALTINATDLQRWLSDSVQAEDNDGSCDEEATAEDVLTTASLEEDTLTIDELVDGGDDITLPIVS